MKLDAIGVAFVGLAVCFALVALYERLRRAREFDKSAVPVALADVKIGQATHTTGLVGIRGETHHAPLGAPSVCVFHRVVVENVETGTIVLDTRSSDELVLEDGVGARLHVHLDGARLLFARHHEVVSSPEVADVLVVQFLAERGIEVNFPVRARVEWIAPRELVFVRGVAREGAPGEAGYRTSARSELEMHAAPNEPVIVSLDELPESAVA